MPHTPNILLIYTGGTIGMVENPETARWRVLILTTSYSTYPSFAALTAA